MHQQPNDNETDNTPNDKVSELPRTTEEAITYLRELRQLSQNELEQEFGSECHCRAVTLVQDRLDDARAYLRNLSKLPLEEFDEALGSEAHRDADAIVYGTLPYETLIAHTETVRANVAKVNQASEKGTEAHLIALMQRDNNLLHRILAGEEHKGIPSCRD
jgi:hypothetical protein